MTPSEIAMKFASASATCKNGKCPYSSQCRGTSDTCLLKEVAMVIRSLMAENSTLKAQYDALRLISHASLEYIQELEKVNQYYYQLCTKFQEGYRPKSKIVKKETRMYRKKKRPKDLTKIDGDERYAYEEPKEKTELPVVII